MSKIQSIHIKNFKFFGEAAPIVLNGKNLLLYGENGSGKSSIYNALYTLLEAASKDHAGVQKYFLPLSPTNSESLVNIHAKSDDEGNFDSFIEITDDTGKTYRLSGNDAELCGNPSFQESQRASGFINYQSLFHFQVFRNSEESNLHEVFKRAVIPYLTCSAYEYMGNTLTTVYDLFKAYLDVKSIMQDNPKGKKVIYRNSVLYQNYLKLEKRINKELSEVIEYINVQLPSILRQLGYTFNAYLRYTDQSHDKYDMRLEFHPFGVFLEIDEYEGKKFNENAPIKHPNVFLNEAKMSALAFAIRWAIFTKKVGSTVAPDVLHVLALDDLMISLDMSNREKLIDLLLNSYRGQYQILFFTHDANLYSFVDRKITQFKQRDEWIKKEMYVGKHLNREIPVIIDGECDSLDKARKYYQARDYTVSALYLRKAIEEYIQEYLPEEYCKNADGKFVDLNTLWKRFVKMSNQIPQPIKEAFDQSRLLILNPSVHYQRLSMPVYRGELVKAFKMVDDLKALTLDVKILLIAKGSTLVFKHPMVNYTFEFEVIEDAIRGKNEDPKCHIKTWQYNGIEFYDFRTGSQGNPPPVAEPKLERMISNLMSVPHLNITREMFMECTQIDGGTLKEAME